MTVGTMNEQARHDDVSPAMILAALRVLRAGLPADPLGFTVCVAERDRAFGPIRPAINRILNDEANADRRIRTAADMMTTFDASELARVESAVAEEVAAALRLVDGARRRGRRGDLPYRMLLDAAGPDIATDESLSLFDELEAVRSLLDETRRENERLSSRLAVAETASDTDALTGVPNRRFLDRLLAAQVKAAKREPLSVALLDIDRFKAFNDRYGHEVGDLVLRLVARTIGGALRDGDTIARFGGEEFVVVLPRADAQVAVRVADRLRATLEQREVMNRRTGMGHGRVTASFGTATLSEGETPEDLLRRADAALYRAKQNGRNRVEAAD